MGRRPARTFHEPVAPPRSNSRRYWVGQPIAVDNTPLATYLTDQWLPAVKSGIEPTTYKAVEQSTRLYINPHIGHVPVAGIDRGMLKEFYQEFLRTPLTHRSGCLGKGTVIHVHSTLCWALQNLVEARRLPYNPAWGIRPRMKKSERYQPTIWSSGPTTHAF